MKNNANHTRIGGPSASPGAQPNRQSPPPSAKDDGQAFRSEIQSRLSSNPAWTIIEPDLERWIALRSGEKPTDDRERRILSILHGHLEPDESDPIESAAGLVELVADAIDGPRFDHTTERERWYPEAACSEGIHYLNATGRQFVGDRRRR